MRVRNGWAPDRRADAWRRLLDRDYHTPLTRISGVSLLRSARMHDTDRRALPYATSHIEATPEFFVCAQGVLERLGEHPGGVQPWIARDWLVQNCVGRVRGSWRWMVTCERHQGYNPLVCDQRKFELDVERMVREVFPHLGHWEGLDDVQEAEDDAAAVGSMDIPEDIMNEVTGHSRGEANYNSHDEDEDDVDDYYTANMNHVANVLTTDYVIVPWDEHEGILLPSPPFCIRNRLDPIVCDEKWRFTWRAMVDESDGDVLH